MAKRKIRNHSSKALRSLIGNAVIQHLRVPRISKDKKPITYKNTVTYRAGDTTIAHRKGEVRMRKLHSRHDLYHWFNVSKFSIKPNQRLRAVLQQSKDKQYKYQSEQNEQDQNQENNQNRVNQNQENNQNRVNQNQENNQNRVNQNQDSTYNPFKNRR